MAHTGDTRLLPKPSEAPGEPGSNRPGTRCFLPGSPSSSLVPLRRGVAAGPFDRAVDAHPLAAGRCVEKGCVYPVALPGLRQCIHHLREELEPAMFHSQQPTMLLLDQARFGPPNPADTGDRARDRRRWLMLRREFLNEAA